jgi:hypothetical protein
LNFNLSKILSPQKRQKDLIVLLAAKQPDQKLLDVLAGCPMVTLREAFTIQGVLQNLLGVNLVILGEVMPMTGLSADVLIRTLETSGIPVTSAEDFLERPDEWMAQARLTSARQVTILPSRQVNLVNWSGGVGKTTLAMAICKRFVERTSLPAALLELGMGGCALHARVSADVPEFFTIATQNVPPARWHGVSLYPMDGRTADVMWSEEPERVLSVIEETRKQHTLLVVDANPAHPLFGQLSTPRPGRINLIVSSPRDDALLQAKRLADELGQDAQLVLNMTRSLADRAGAQAAVTLPFSETWANTLDPHLSDPILELIYSGWSRRSK